MAFDVMNKIVSSSSQTGVSKATSGGQVSASSTVTKACKAKETSAESFHSVCEQTCFVENFFFDDYIRMMTDWSYFSAAGGSTFDGTDVGSLPDDEEITEKVKTENKSSSGSSELSPKSRLSKPVKSLNAENISENRLKKEQTLEPKTEISKSERGLVKSFLEGLKKPFSMKGTAGVGKQLQGSSSEVQDNSPNKKDQLKRVASAIRNLSGQGKIKEQASVIAAKSNSKLKGKKKGRIWKSLVSKNVTTLKQKPNLGAKIDQPRSQVLNRDVARMLHHAKSCMQNGSSLLTSNLDALSDGALLLQAKLAQQILKKGRSSANKAFITNSGKVAVSNLKATMSLQVADKISRLLLPENEGEMVRFLRLQNVLSQELKSADVAALYSYYYGSQERNGDERGGFADQSSEEDFAIKDYGEYMVNGAFQLYYLA